MFDLHGLRSQRRPDPGLLALEEPRPLGVGLGEVDRRVVLGEISDRRCTYLVVGERHAETLSRGTLAHEDRAKLTFEEDEDG